MAGHAAWKYSNARGPIRETHSHAIDLHKRSRSPKNGRRGSDEDESEQTARNDPASALGTFIKSAGSVGDSKQEGPWKIDLPTEETKDGGGATRQQPAQPVPEQKAQQAERDAPEEAEARPTPEEESQRRAQPTVAEKVMGVQVARGPLPLQGSASTGNVRPAGEQKEPSPVELPGSLAAGDEREEEEIVMSATAYPGQEWMPDMGGYGHWDD